MNYGSNAEDNEDSWEINRNNIMNFYKFDSRRASSIDRYENNSDESDSRVRKLQSPYHLDSTADQSQLSETDEECAERQHSDNNNHCDNSYRTKSKSEQGSSRTKNEKRGATTNRQEVQASKPVLKFSVNAILGSDHGKNSFKPGKFQIYYLSGY